MTHTRVFDFSQCSLEDRSIAHRYIGSLHTPVDRVIAPDGNPYIYRWHVIPRNSHANVYFHVQVADDPERPLHDHPWDNTSVILAGGYEEVLMSWPGVDPSRRHYDRKVGDVIFREASWAHRLLLAPGVKYTMTQFSTGPKVREWGFWYPDGWRPADDVVENDNGFSRRV
jgi:hypothetical protein